MMARHTNLILSLENYSLEQIEQLAALLTEMEEGQQAEKLYQYLLQNQAL